MVTQERNAAVLRKAGLFSASLLVLALAASRAAAQAPKSLPVQPAQVSLVGLLKARVYYPAPGSGDDRREQFLVVVLDEPVRVVAPGGALLEEASEFEVSSDKPVRLAKLVGDRVSLQGVLFLGREGRNHTRVVLKASAVQSVED
jgi:hypothetical protein